MTYGPEGLAEIKEFLDENRHQGYTLSLYNILEECTAEITCSPEDMLAAIGAAVDLEHDFPSWIEVNELSESYVVGLNFTRGNLETPGLYEFKGGRFKRLRSGNEA